MELISSLLHVSQQLGIVAFLVLIIMWLIWKLKGKDLWKENRLKHERIKEIHNLLSGSDSLGVSLRAIKQIQENLLICQAAQAECIKCQENIYNRPYERCEKFAECPVFSQQTKLLEDIANGMKDIVDNRIKFREETLRIVSENKDLILDFVTKFGDVLLKHYERLDKPHD